MCEKKNKKKTTFGLYFSNQKRSLLMLFFLSMVKGAKKKVFICVRGCLNLGAAIVNLIPILRSYAFAQCLHEWVFKQLVYNAALYPTVGLYAGPIGCSSLMPRLSFLTLISR